MDGIELASRFSYITNTLRYCGPEEAAKAFLAYIEHKKEPEAVRTAIAKFEGLPPYLRILGKRAGKDFLDYDVVEAYWIGNELLEQCTDDDCREAITELMKRGLPEYLGKKLIAELPPGFTLHHNFNVFYVGVGNTSGKVKTTLQNRDNCRISWGKVVETSLNTLYVETQPLLWRDGFFLGDTETKTAVFLKEMLPEIKTGDVVALHWGFAPVILNEEQLSHLQKYTQRIIDVLNTVQSSAPRSSDTGQKSD